MSRTSADELANCQPTVADLQRQLAEAQAERDEAQRRLIERTAERDESEAQAAAVAEVMQVINSSPGDLTPVFDAMLEKAIRLCDAAFGSLWTYDGASFHSVALRNAPAELADFIGRPYPAGPTTPLGRVARSKRIVAIADLASDEISQSGTKTDREWVAAPVQLGGARSYLAIPLLKDDVLVGAFALARRDVKPFTDKQIALLENFAAQAVIAMENARLLTETREALEQQTATAEVLQVINSSPGDLAPVFEAMLEKAMRLCEAAFGVLVTLDGRNFRVVAHRNVPPAFVDYVGPGPTPLDPATQLGQAVFERRVVHTLDDADSDAYRQRAPLAVAAVEIGGIRTVLHIPLIKDGQVLGVLIVFRQKVRPYSEKQIALLQNFAVQAVIAMENARLLGELRHRTEEVAELNRGLEVRVAEQVEELSRVGRLKRFLAPQLAELIVSRGDEQMLESHRREIVVVFCDLRGYTAFTETAEPEEVLDFLSEYHGTLGPLVSQFEGTLDQFSGDGIMVFFNDPVPCADPAERAVKMAMAMREAAGKLIAAWRRRDRDLGFGVGIAQGYATLGQIGFAERSGYTAIGTVCNLAARLCAEAKDGQILISGRVAAAIEKVIPLEDLGRLTLKGLSQPISTFNVPLAASQPALRVIEGGPPNG